MATCVVISTSWRMPARGHGSTTGLGALASSNFLL